jgi:hypothetical protein
VSLTFAVCYMYKIIILLNCLSGVSHLTCSLEYWNTRLNQSNHDSLRFGRGAVYANNMDWLSLRRHIINSVGKTCRYRMIEILNIREL